MHGWMRLLEEPARILRLKRVFPQGVGRKTHQLELVDTAAYPLLLWPFRKPFQATMRFFLTTLLICLLLVTQSLAVVPHWHFESADLTPVQHANRPHVHFHGVNGHHHHGENLTSTSSYPTSSSEPVDHDGDAIYLGDSAAAIKAASELSPGLAASSQLGCWVNISCLGTDLGNGNRVASISGHVLLSPRCARYVQLLSIRC